MCNHLMDQKLYHEEHMEWINSHDINMLVFKDGKFVKRNYEALRKVVEKECKIQE